MIRIQVDLGPLEEWPTSRLPGLADRLLKLLPGLAHHGCSSGKPGGLLRRLEEGTWLGHVTEHVALELQGMAGTTVTRGKTRSVKGEPGVYNVMFEYDSEPLGLAAGRCAIELLDVLLPPELAGAEGLERICERPFEGDFDLPNAVAALKAIGAANRLGPSTAAIVAEAARRGIPWQRLDRHSFIQFGTGRWQKRIRASITSDTSHLAVETAGDKDLTKQLLSAAGLPVPEGDIVRDKAGAVRVANRIGYPVVLKPLDGNHGRGVTTGVATPAEVEDAFDRAIQHRSAVLVERHFTGRDYRVLVVGGEVAAAAERRPASVISNGRDTILALIEAVNADPRRGAGHENVMTRIRLGADTEWRLARHGLTLGSVPAAGVEIVLTDTANLSTGGTAIDRTAEIHPDNAAVARRAAVAVGLDVAGIDIVMPDIARSWRDVGGGIVEVNAAPGLRMHLHPAEGTPRPVARPIVSALFPAGRPVRVPVAAITGTNGKSTTVRMVAHILSHSGKVVGFTSTSGVYVGGEMIWKGDASGPNSARRVLKDPTVDFAVLETARGGILREGLAVPEVDVGAVLNVSEDHLGLKGVNSLDDLAAVKSVVTESVRSGGMSVLNADDARTLAMARHAGGKLCLFSMTSALTGPVGKHVSAGGLAVLRQAIGGLDQIVLHEGRQQIPIIPVEGIPATHGGALEFNVQNALAAAAVCVGLGLDPDTIGRALGSFASTFEQNPGRFNVHDGHGFRVILDYAHNPAALTALLRSIRSIRPAESRLLGTISTPGDRRDEDIRAMGRIAGEEFDLVVFRELPDTRGRPAGEIVRLLSEGAREAGCSPNRIICFRSEKEATRECLLQARPGDIVVLTPSDVEAVWQQALEFEPKPVAPRQVAAAAWPKVPAR
jgi:cyanophycin synthetase